MRLTCDGRHGQKLKEAGNCRDSTAAQSHVTAPFPGWNKDVCLLNDAMVYSKDAETRLGNCQLLSPRSLANGRVLGGGQVEMARLIGDRRLRLVVMRADEAGDGRHLHGLGLGVEGVGVRARNGTIARGVSSVSF